jgi:leader peptidase (prepilin peptidase)/N-methyltransferase
VRAIRRWQIHDTLPGVDGSGALPPDGLPPLDGLIVYAVAGLFGALWGSFFNVCIARVPLGQSVVSPGSHCFSCNAPVRAFDNVPILSYLLLRGRCRSCGARFSPRYALVEALCAGLSVLLWWRFGAVADGAALGLHVARYAYGFAFTGVLVVLSFIDLDTKRLPDVITLPSVLIFFLAGLGTGGVAWLDRLIGAAAGYGVIWVVSTVYYYSTGREGLGLGDAKLLAVIGAALGWRALPMVIFGASFVGILVSVPLLLLKQRAERRAAPQADRPEGESAGDIPAIRRAEVPFGPFLALAALVYLFAGDQLWTAFLSRLGGGELP